MKAIEKIKMKLKAYPAVQYSIDGNTLRVQAHRDNGFSVWLSEQKHGFTVGFDGWHEEFEREEEALSAFAFGLSDRCRLKVIQYGGVESVWVVEGMDSFGRWQEDSRTGLLFKPLWKKKRVVYRQNSLISNANQSENSTE